MRTSISECVVFSGIPRVHGNFQTCRTHYRVGAVLASASGWLVLGTRSTRGGFIRFMDQVQDHLGGFRLSQEPAEVVLLQMAKDVFHRL